MHIFVDEAGTSNEKVAVAAAIIINPQHQFLAVEDSLRIAWDGVFPLGREADFIFHGKDIFGKYKTELSWSMKDANHAISAGLQVLLKHRVPICIGWWRKGFGTKGSPKEENEIAHEAAILQAVGIADRYIRQHHSESVASLVVEKSNNGDKIVRRAVNLLKSGALKNLGYFMHETVQIKDGTFFAQKDEAMLLQLADLCAYSFSRFINRKAGGDRLWSYMNGNHSFQIRIDISSRAHGGVLINMPEGKTVNLSGI